MTPSKIQTGPVLVLWPRHIKLLRALAARGSGSIKDLAAKTELPGASVRAAVYEMRRGNLIVRRGPGDYVVTDAGKFQLWCLDSRPTLFQEREGLRVP
jgi:DNA-binding MarR family transcriptional regulator